MKTKLLIMASFVALASCGPRHQPGQPTTNANAPVIPEPSAPPAVTIRQAAPAEPTAKEPTIDPKSSEAAVELVRSFVLLLNRQKFDEAYMLLGPNSEPRSQFDNGLKGIENLLVTVGSAGDQEGAAGSIYLSVPLTISGTQGGKRISRSATAILRRVNDVPGSTEAERHWHIERIDWGNA